jgi:mannose-6-phosphate isomerase-like protein (cupin superfamily)
MKAGKVWGETKTLLSTPLIEFHSIFIIPNSWCSWHKHEFKWNAFHVVSGKLTIEVRKKNYELVDCTILYPGDTMSVPPGEYHRFVSHDEYTVALELYYPGILGEDIVREDVGGSK